MILAEKVTYSMIYFCEIDGSGWKIGYFNQFWFIIFRILNQSESGNPMERKIASLKAENETLLVLNELIGTWSYKLRRTKTKS